jgi:cyclopropane fatty-acyl-phospholipid synthase-like methyltransferase
VNNEMLVHMDLITQGRQPKKMRILEIGCGAGRMTRALAGLFGENHTVDKRRNDSLGEARSVGSWERRPVQEQRTDLAGLRHSHYDFAFSFIVFQHIPAWP